jgi:hypothetical protein
VTDQFLNMKKIFLIIIFSLIFAKQAEAKSVDELLQEYKKEYSDWKVEQTIKQKVDELVSIYPDKNKTNQKIIARAFYLAFDEWTARIALATAKNEAGFRSDATNYNPKYGTWDKGCWQINDIHRVPDEIRFNCKKATEWAIQKVKRDGGFGAWVAYHKFVKGKI